MGKTGWIITGVLVVFFVALALYNGNSTSSSKQVVSATWSEQMSEGKADAPNTFIEYTDITCPHCADFHNAAKAGSFDKDYIDSSKVRMEIRVTSLLQGVSVNSVRAGESAYCAADQKKFYAYYNGIVETLTKDYFSKGIGTERTGPQIPKLDDQYYVDVATTTGLDSSEMKDCLSSNKQQAAVNTATQKAIKAGITGVPAFNVNNGKYTGSGFGGDYSTVQRMMRAGGVN